MKNIYSFRTESMHMPFSAPDIGYVILWIDKSAVKK